MSYKMVLTKSISVVGEPVGEIEFRDPIGSDLVYAGYPFRMVTTGIQSESVRQIDTVAVNKLIARLCSIPEAAVSTMNFWDWTRAMGVVMGFLAPPTLKES